MSLELIKDKVLFDQKIGKEKTQVLLEGDIIVPDIKPDVSLVLKTDGKIHMDSIEVEDGKVVFEGELVLTVLYLAREADKPVHCMATSLPVRDSINIEDVRSETWVDLDYELSHMEHKLINDRKISVRAVIEVQAKAATPLEKEIVTGIQEEQKMQYIKTPMYISKNMDHKEDRFVIKDELLLPSGKPNIREILKCSVKVSDKEIRVVSDKVNVKGSLMVTTLYVGDTDESLVELCEHEIPFNGSIDAKDAKEDMLGDAVLKIENEYIQARPDADGEERIVEVEVTIGAKVKLVSQMEMDVIEDAYCINKDLKLVKDSVKYPKHVCSNKNQCTIKDTVQITEKCPPMMQVYQVEGHPKIDETRIMDDRIMIEGYIPVDVLYVAESDTTPLYSFSANVPFSHAIDAKGAKPHMEASIEKSVDHISFNMLSESELEVRFLISFHAQVTEDVESLLITDIELLDTDSKKYDEMASMIIYVVQDEDNLWKIAKKYNTSIEELLSLNDLDSDAKLYSGQKLLILKKIIEE